jgi:alkanesulfonate monooxygenase SsuD/methylene tetrahydromethanopterin reductase-like flavin-dependent oxidoreductase (luciferase family)
MRYGMTLPTMVPEYDRTTTLEWCRRIEDGPYASLAVGERITFPNQEQGVMLAAAAALTERVRIIAAIVIVPMHPVPLLAKQTATLDVLSGGRFSLGVGVGGREHDYRSAGSSFERRHQRLDEAVAELRRLWAGNPPFDGADPIGPPPAQAGGPPILSSSFGPLSLARSARWADGYAGFTLTADPDELALVARQVRQAWLEAGRIKPPSLMTSFWFSLGSDAADRQRRYVQAYMRYDPDAAAYMTETAVLSSEQAVRAAVHAASSAGFDELMFVPTTSDLAELDRLERLLSDPPVAATVGRSADVPAPLRGGLPSRPASGPLR